MRQTRNYGGEPPEYCPYGDTSATYYIVSLGKVLAEYRSLTGSPAFTYLYAGDQRIAMRDNQNKLHYYLNDHLGSARVVMDSTGAVKDRYHYFAYGAPSDVSVTTNQPDRYTGKPYDQEANLNLYYYRARYYDGDLGKFTQVDPARDRSPNWGPYVYTKDDPIKHVDPDERNAFLAALGAGFLGGAAVEYLSQKSGGHIFSPSQYDFSKQTDWHAVVGAGYYLEQWWDWQVAHPNTSRGPFLP